MNEDRTIVPPLELPDIGAETMKVSAVDRLVEQLRDLVRVRGLVIGDPLPTERELGEMFEAGRNTVREALQVLRAYGIVEVRPKVGAVLGGRHEEAVRKLFAFQNEISPASFLDVQGYRRIIEVGIGDHIILHATANDLAGLDAVNEEMLEATGVAEAARADFAFHEAIVGLAENNTLMTNYRLLQPMITHIMRVGKEARLIQNDTFAAHKGIIDALKARDRMAYAYLISRHLEFGLQFVEANKEQTKE